MLMDKATLSFLEANASAMPNLPAFVTHALTNPPIRPMHRTFRTLGRLPNPTINENGVWLSLGIAAILLDGIAYEAEVETRQTQVILRTVARCADIIIHLKKQPPGDNQNGKTDLMLEDCNAVEKLEKCVFPSSTCMKHTKGRC